MSFRMKPELRMSETELVPFAISKVLTERSQGRDTPDSVEEMCTMLVSHCLMQV